MNRSTLNILCVASFALVAACSGGGSSGTSPVAGQSPAGNTGAAGQISSGGTTEQASSGGSTVTQPGGSTETGGSPGGTISSGGVAETGGVTTPAGGTSASSTAKTGGTTNPGGTTSSGGATTAGGTTSSGGATTAGGTTAKTGGATSSGGATTAGGTTAKTGGATSSGGATTAGGTTAKTGGATSSGGVTSSAGTTGAGDGGMSIDPNTVVPDLEGFYWEGTCSGNIAIHGKNCPFAPVGSTSTTCPAGSGTFATRGAIRDKVLNVKGTTGTPYTITFEVRGVLGTRCYTGGTPAVANMTPNANGPNNTWYVGGTQANNSIWNTYELHIAPPVTGEANIYYFNSFPSNVVGWCEKEASFQIGYTASFKVLGGGTMTFEIHDANCLVMQNCGPDDTASTCTAPRTIDLSGMTPPATFTQPPTNLVSGTTYYPQWAYFSVKSVTSP
jgi:hypothetical protein